MSISNRINTLESRHYEIEEQIREAYLSHKNSDEITTLKKQKLQLKQEIFDLDSNKT